MRIILFTIKSIILAALVLTSIYQTGELWFEGTSNRNFFYPFSEGTSQAFSESLKVEGNILSPYEIGVYLGTSTIEYTMLKSTSPYFEEVRESFINILKEGIKEDHYIGVLEDEAAYYEGQHYVMFLPYDLTGELFMQNFGLSSDDVKQVNMIHSIAIRPSKKDSSFISIFLEEAESGLIHEYQLSSDLASIEDERMAYNLANIGEEVNLSSYISTKGLQSSYFDRNLLLPTPFGQLRYHETLYYSKPYISNGAFDEEGLRNYLSIFFNNPDIMRPVMFDNEVTYTDGSVVVKYNQEGLLQYTRTPSSSASSTNLSAAITMANQFLERDIRANPVEVIMTGYNRSEGAITFYYELGYNGFRIEISDALKEKYAMRTPIELTVYGDRVIQYKRMVRNVDETIPTDHNFSMPYTQVLDQIIADQGALTNPVRDMYLAYRWDVDQEELGLYWYVIIGQEAYYIRVEAD